MERAPLRNLLTLNPPANAEILTQPQPHYFHAMVLAILRIGDLSFSMYMY